MNNASAGNSRANKVCVIGGGISGLACLYRLRQLGIEARLLESHARVGGVISTVVQNGFLFESGPQSFLATNTLLSLIHELDLDNDLIAADSRAPRFVVRNGRLHEIPMAPGALLRSGLLGVSTKARLLADALGRTHPPAREESVADFVRRKFGNEILDYLVAPFISGVFAGDPESLSLASAFPSAHEWERDYGSILRGALKSAKAAGKRPSLASFRGGMETLPDRMAERLARSIHLNVSPAQLSFNAGNWMIHAETAPSASTSSPAPSVATLAHPRDIASGAPFFLDCRAVILATPAYAAARLLPTGAQSVADLLEGIAYAPLAVVAAGYHQKQIGRPLDGFGFLVPRKEGLTSLGTVWNSSLFAGRAPDGMAVLTSFAGGATNLAIRQMTDTSILDVVARENAKLLEISGPPVEHAVFRYDRALPQYTLGHPQRIRAINSALQGIPGIFLTGNYLAGSSIGHCVEHAFRAAESATAYLN